MVSKTRLGYIVVSVVVVAIIVGLFTMKDVRNGIIATLKGTVKDSAMVANGKPPKATPAPAPAPTGQPVQSDVQKVPDNIKIHVLNVSGTATLVVEGKTALLIDGSDGTDTDKIINYMKSLGLEKLRYVVATNYHNTSMGGVQKIISYFPSDYIFMSQNVADDQKGVNLRSYLDSKKLIWTIPSDRGRFKLENAYFELLPTHEGGSLVTILYNGDNKFVFTGDITRVDDPTIKQLPIGVDLYDISAMDSGYVMPKGVLDQIKPKNVIISSKGDDQETKGVISMLQGKELTTYNSSQTGVVVVGSNGTDVTFNYEKEAKKN